MEIKISISGNFFVAKKVDESDGMTCYNLYFNDELVAFNCWGIKVCYAQADKYLRK